MGRLPSPRLCSVGSHTAVPYRAPGSWAGAGSRLRGLLGSRPLGRSCPGALSGVLSVRRPGPREEVGSGALTIVWTLDPCAW